MKNSINTYIFLAQKEAKNAYNNVMSEYYNMLNEKDANYTNKEEKINMTISEQYTAHKTGEFPQGVSTRTNHSGKSARYVKVKSPTSTTIIE